MCNTDKIENTESSPSERSAAVVQLREKTELQHGHLRTGDLMKRFAKKSAPLHETERFQQKDNLPEPIWEEAQSLYDPIVAFKNGNKLFFPCTEGLSMSLNIQGTNNSNLAHKILEYRKVREHG